MTDTLPTQMNLAGGEFGKRLRAIRLRMSLSQSDIGRGVGVTKASVSGWEIGRSHPSIPQVERLAAFLRVPPSAFFSDADKRAVNPLDAHRLRDVLANIEDCAMREFAQLSPDKKARLIAHLYVLDDQPSKPALQSLMELVR